MMHAVSAAAKLAFNPLLTFFCQSQAYEYEQEKEYVSLKDNLR
jgi:hypothetical protein